MESRAPSLPSMCKGSGEGCACCLRDSEGKGTEDRWRDRWVDRQTVGGMLVERWVDKRMLSDVKNTKGRVVKHGR